MRLYATICNLGSEDTTTQRQRQQHQLQSSGVVDPSESVREWCRVSLPRVCPARAANVCVFVCVYVKQVNAVSINGSQRLSGIWVGIYSHANTNTGKDRAFVMELLVYVKCIHTNPSIYYNSTQYSMYSSYILYIYICCGVYKAALRLSGGIFVRVSMR